MREASAMRPFDAVLVIAFGGPQGLADVRPFLANVLRGRRVAPERVEEVAHHYELFGGVSPLTDLTLKQATALRARLDQRGLALPVYVGMRNWHPYLADTMAQMARDGVRRAVGFIGAAHRSYSGCTQYKENVVAACAGVVAAGLPGVEVTFVSDWHLHPGFVTANAEHVARAFASLREDLRAGARLIFTAHSIPVSMAEKYPYERQLRESAEAIYQAWRSRMRSAAASESHDGKTPYELVYQSRSGRPEDAWLEPDICDYLRAAARTGLRAAVVCPVGFICDHIEVLYDLDVEAAAVARELDVELARASAVNDHPAFIDTMVESIAGTVRAYRNGRPLPVVAGA